MPSEFRLLWAALLVMIVNCRPRAPVFISKGRRTLNGPMSAAIHDNVEIHAHVRCNAVCAVIISLRNKDNLEWSTQTARRPLRCAVSPSPVVVTGDGTHVDVRTLALRRWFNRYELRWRLGLGGVVHQVDVAPSHPSPPGAHLL